MLKTFVCFSPHVFLSMNSSWKDGKNPAFGKRNSLYRLVGALMSPNPGYGGIVRHTNCMWGRKGGACMWWKVWRDNSCHFTGWYVKSRSPQLLGSREFAITLQVEKYGKSTHSMVSTEGFLAHHMDGKDVIRPLPHLWLRNVLSRWEWGLVNADCNNCRALSDLYKRKTAFVPQEPPKYVKTLSSIFVQPPQHLVAFVILELKSQSWFM